MKQNKSILRIAVTPPFTVGYLMTGSVLVGGAIAVVEPAVNTVVYHFHERFWTHREQRKFNEVRDPAGLAPA